MSHFNAGIKRAFDLAVALMALVLSSPMLLATAFLIRFSSAGPALYRQERLGKDGKPFTLLKFRTMVADALDIRNPDGSTFSAEDDPRVTPIGKILRSTSIDELPQLINVIQGDMSLVGPRPDRVDQLIYYSERELKKLNVKPGITGLAQISGRNEIPWKQRREIDAKYAESQSLRLDFQILIRTIPYVLRREGVFTDQSTN